MILHQGKKRFFCTNPRRMQRWQSDCQRGHRLAADAGDGTMGRGPGSSGENPPRKAALVCGGSPVPKPRPEVITARHEAGVGGRVHYTAHDVVVAQREQISALRCP